YRPVVWSDSARSVDVRRARARAHRVRRGASTDCRLALRCERRDSAAARDAHEQRAEPALTIDFGTAVCRRWRMTSTAPLDRFALAPDLTICRILNGMWQVSGAHGRIDREKALAAMAAHVD